MAISAILLQPGNRLLQGGTADFAMFGAQPATVSVREAAANDSGFLSAFADTGAEPQSAGRADEHATPASLYSGPTADPDIAGTLSQSSLSPLDGTGGITLPAGPATIGGSAAPSIGPVDAPVSPVEQSGVASEQVRGPGAASSDGLTANPFHAPILDAVAPTVAPNAIALAGGLAAASLAPVLSFGDGLTASTVTTIVPPIAEGIGTVADLRAGAVADVSNLVDRVAPEALGHVADIAGSLAVGTSDTAVSVVAGIPESIDQATGPLSETTGALAVAVGDTVVATADAVGTVAVAPSPIVEDSVAATVMPLVDHLAGDAPQDAAPVGEILSGTDPAGGLATLTAMVGAADVFEIADDSAGTTIDTVASTLDAVPLDGESAAPLLGDDHGVDGLLHHDDGSIGIGGL